MPRSFTYDPRLVHFRKDIPDGPSGTGAHHLDRLADLLVEANPEIDRATALGWLLHNRVGRALAAFFNKHGPAAVAGMFKRKEPVMTRTEHLAAIAKDYGVVRFAKYIVDNGPSGITEAEFTKLVTDYAPRNAGERPDSAFARAFGAATEDGATLRKAHATIKNYPQMVTLEPTFVGGAEATDVNDGEKAYGKLMALAEEQRKRSPTLTIAQAFAAVAAETTNAKLLADAVLRSRARATSQFPGIVG